MRSIGLISASIVLFLFSFSSLSPAADVPVGSVLTQAQIAAATGVTVTPGAPISAPTSCQWSGSGKIVTLTIRQPLAGKSPVSIS